MPRYMDRLRDGAVRERLLDEMRSGREGGIPPLWETWVISNVESEANLGLIGRSLAEIAEARGVEPEEATLQLIEEEEDAVMAVVHNRVESDIRFFMGHPQAMIGSDGNAVSPDGPYRDFKPHPRFYGTYPRILGRYVQEQPSVLTLEEAVYKMAGLPGEEARAQGSRADRGGSGGGHSRIRPGYRDRQRHVRGPAPFPDGHPARLRGRRGDRAGRRAHRRNPRPGAETRNVDVGAAPPHPNLLPPGEKDLT